MITDQRGRPRIATPDVVSGVKGACDSNSDDDVDQGRAGLAWRKRRLRETVGWKLVSLITAERKVRSSQIVYQSHDRDLGRNVVAVDHDGQLHSRHHTADGLVASVPLGADKDIAAARNEQNKGKQAGQAKTSHNSAPANFTPKSGGSGLLAPFGDPKKLRAGENRFAIEMVFQFVEKRDWFRPDKEVSSSSVCSYVRLGGGCNLG